MTYPYSILSSEIAVHSSGNTNQGSRWPQAEIPKLARRILETAKGPKSLWTKWSSDREDVIKRAADVWIPLDDLREALNVLPGENLTATDVEQRLNAVRSELGGYTHGPDETLKEEAFTAYATEKAKARSSLLSWDGWKTGCGVPRRFYDENRPKSVNGVLSRKGDKPRHGYAQVPTALGLRWKFQRWTRAVLAQ